MFNSTCGCGNNWGNWSNNGGCGNNGCGNNGTGWGSGWGNNLGCSAFGFVGEWVNIVVTLTILQSILGLVCNWNCGGCGCGN